VVLAGLVERHFTSYCRFLRQGRWSLTAVRRLISRLRRETVFYDLPPARRRGRKERPRKYAPKHRAQEWAATQQRWNAVTLRLYGKEAHLQLKSRVVLQRTLGVRIRLVAVQWGQRRLVFLFSTDTRMTAAQIVRAYCARFALETGFRGGKQQLGLSTYHVRRASSGSCISLSVRRRCCGWHVGKRKRSRCTATGGSRWTT
jgi:hypothetical protein